MTLDPAKDPSCVLALDWTEPSGSIAYDRSQYGNNGTIYGAIRTKGIYSKAIQLDGIDDYVEVPESSSLSSATDNSYEFTMLAWIKVFEDSSSEQIIISNPERIGILPGLYPYFFTGLSNTTSVMTYTSTAIKTNKWYLITGIFNHGNAYIYVNDVLKGSALGSAETTRSLSQPTRIGVASWDTSTYLFNGIIGSVRIYNRALSEKEIRSLYYYGIKKLRRLPY